MPEDRDLFGAPVAPVKQPPAPKGPTWYVVPSGTTGTKCRGESCGATVYFVKGYPAPISCDVEGATHPNRLTSQDGRGVSHFVDCPDREDFRARDRR
jgi:hypothetical protein